MFNEAASPPLLPTGEYEDLLSRRPEMLFETQAPYRAANRWSERHLQCVWYNDRLRPTELTTEGGEVVKVLSPGRWNLEAGPDFLGASLLVGTEERRVEGDVEIHVRPAAWTHHGHARDPRYANVVAHVTYAAGPRPDDLPERVLEISLREPLRGRPRFSFDDIDLGAYPHALLPRTPRPCQAAWGDDPDKGIAILEAAGRFRLERKRLRMEDLVQRTGDPRQALYEGCMAALGYKRNAAAFRTLARSHRLSAWAAGDPFADYAVMLGLGGLLPVERPEGMEASGISARLWRHWWRNPEPEPVPPLEWHLDATRPGNHPRRRLAAAAALFSSIDRWYPRLLSADLTAQSLAKDIGRLLQANATWPAIMGFLDEGGKNGRSSLLGEGRAAVLVNNAVMPFLGALHPDRVPAMAAALRPETPNSIMRTMANRLFGRDHNPVVLYGRSGLRQQGLLQIYNDFCLNTKDACRDCLFGKGTSGEEHR